MENNLILEIKRLNTLMGLKEQGFTKLAWLDNAVGTFDNFTNTLAKFRNKGVPMTNKEIDEFVDALKKSGNISETEAKELMDLFINNKEIRKVLSTTDDFLTDMKNIYQLSEPPSLLIMKKLSKLTSAQMDLIMDDVLESLKTTITTAGTSLNNSYINFVKNFKSAIQKIIDNKEIINSVDDIYNSIDDRITVWLQNNVTNGKLSFKDAEQFYEAFSIELRNNAEIAAKIEELKVAGLLETNPPKIQRPSKVSGYTPKNDPLNDLLGSAKSKNTDGTVKVKSDNTTEPVDNGVEIEFDIPSNVSDVTATMEKRYPGFFSKYLSNYTTDTLYNILRTYFGARSSSAFYKKVEEINNTLVNDFLPKFTSQLDTINKDGIEGFAQLDTFTTTVRQLLLDLKISKSNIETWDDLWGKIKLDIKSKASNAGLGDSVDQFITQIEKGGNSKNNIETFISTMREASKNPKLFPVNGGRFALSSKEALSDWLGISKFFKEGNESINKLKSTWKSNVVVDFVPQLFKETWNWFSGFLLYQAPRTIQRILKDINYGGITNGNIIKTAFSTYLAMMFASFFFSPIYDSFRKYTDTIFGAPIESFFEWLGILDPNRKEEYDPTSGKSGFDVLVEGYKNKFKQIMEADLNLDDVVVVGKGPIIEATMSLIEKYTKSKEEVEQEYLNSQNEILNEKISKRLKSNAKKNEDTWAASDNKQRELIKTKNGFKEIERILRNYTDRRLKVNNPNFVPLTYEQYKKIKNSLVFIPGLDESMLSKLTQSTVEEKEKWIQDELTKTTKKVDFVHQVNDVMGYTAIKAKDGKHYKVVQRDLWLHYITPSMEEISVNPNVKQTQNDLNTILDKL